MKTFLSYVYRLVFVAILGAGGYGTWYYFSTEQNLKELLQENEELQKAIHNLSIASPIGYVKVTEQKFSKEGVISKLKFVEVDRDNPRIVLQTKEFEVVGEEIYFDLMLINFDEKYVKDGSKRSIYFWRRAFGDKQKPEEGPLLESIGTGPERYAMISEALSLEDQQSFWKDMWNLSNTPGKLKSMGVQAIMGKAAYRKMEPGLVYSFKLKNTGEITTSISPDI